MFKAASKIQPINAHLIRAFAADARSNNIQVLQVRGNNDFARSLRAAELRSTKHTHLAVGEDEIGNTIILLADGSTRQLLSRAERKAFGLPF